MQGRNPDKYVRNEPPHRPIMKDFGIGKRKDHYQLMSMLPLSDLGTILTSQGA